MKYIDISTFQRTVDFESVKGNVDGVIIRAGYGVGFLGQNVYAGTLDAFIGKMTATWIDMDMSTVTYSAKTNAYVQARIPAPVGIAHILSDRFSNQAASGTVGRMSVASSYLYFNIPAEQVSTADTAGIRAWFSAYKPQFVYEPAASVELTSGAVSIRTLLGENNVWADCGAVPGLYLLGRIRRNKRKIELRTLLRNIGQNNVLLVFLC